MMYKLNPFVYIFKREGVVALYNSINLSTVYLAEEKYENVSQNPTKELIDELYFVEGNFNAHNYFQNHIKKLPDSPSLSIAYFLVTSSCNYKCEYCFVETRFKSSQQDIYMTKEIAQKGIQLVKKNTDKIKIIFYGGEPFLNFEVIKFISEEAKRCDLKTKYSIISNGSIINDKIIEFLKENDVSLSISLDGLKESNDKARKFHNNKGTFDRIEKTLKILKDNDVKFGISCTVSPYNMDSPEEILQILEELDVRGFGYNLLSENNNIKISVEENIAMVKNILAAEDLIFEKKIIEDRIINRKLKPFVEKTNWSRDCAGYGHQIVITPKGEVGTCHGLWPDLINNDTKSYFDIDTNYADKIIDHPTWKEWYHRTPFNMPQCWNCFGIGLCGGGCAKNSLLRKGSIWEIDDSICALTKESISWVIWKYYDTKIKEIVKPSP